MKRENLNLRLFHDKVFFFKDRTSAMRFLVVILTTRNLTRDKIRIDRIKISLMIFIQNLLTIN
jgi:hypothetical protein